MKMGSPLYVTQKGKRRKKVHTYNDVQSLAHSLPRASALCLPSLPMQTLILQGSVVGTIARALSRFAFCTFFLITLILNLTDLMGKKYPQHLKK